MFFARFQRLATWSSHGNNNKILFHQLKPVATFLPASSVQVRFFAPRGIYREQMLEKEKRRREPFDKKFRPVDPGKADELKYATTLEERREMKKGDTAYDKFLAESTQDAEMDKLLDSLIDERMAQGKTDEQILAELGATLAGDASGSHLTPEERHEREE